MEEGSSCDMVGMVFKGEVIVNDNSEFANVSGGTQNGVVDGETEVVGGFDLGPMMSDLSKLSLRKFECIHDFISVKQLVRVE